MSTASQPSSSESAQEIGRILRGGVQTAAQLMAALGVSQPTLSRTIQSLSSTVTAFRVSGDRTPRYALLRQLPLGLHSRQRIYRLLASGSMEPFADVEFLSGGSTLERIGSVTRMYEGLPPYMAFAAPSGFLGRQLAHDAARAQQFPSSLKDWDDEHRVAWLFTRGLNLPGNLVFGDASLQMEIDLRRLDPTPMSEKAAHYVAMASALKGAAYGSSAGGEQPKFLGMTEGSGHVIVKFARLGSRMAELLPLEHLALRSLAEVDVPSSSTQLLTSGDYVFLEVRRFDRVGKSGRIGMLSAGAVDDEFFGRRDSWPEFAARCEKAKYLSAADARRVDTMAAFSELIGNSDRHFENISLLIDEKGEYAGIAPAYDILPMRYASIGGGVDPDLTPIAPKVGTIGAQPAVWARAAQAAERFWTAVQTETLAAQIPEAMRQLAATNLAVAREFVAPLLPAG
ncbi:HipA domain-containing protein [Rhizobacter sp. OV335]|uniref:HipA domain-containing protein n=1 Tax=Rhizobacter sp. OV335 TaxID=1500264 RepID=UPI0013563946|nr:HipA domain-containing protein [Rhizobacter sp. OV335]